MKTAKEILQAITENAAAKGRTIAQCIALALDNLYDAKGRERGMQDNPREAWGIFLGTLQLVHLPSGSGFNRGTLLNMEKSTQSRLVFETDYHHMNDDGHYTEWTSHTVTATATFNGGFDIRISGRNVNGIKEYIEDTFHTCLSNSIQSNS